jgi:hypothetical protein
MCAYQSALVKVVARGKVKKRKGRAWNMRNGTVSCASTWMIQWKCRSSSLDIRYTMTVLQWDMHYSIAKLLRAHGANLRWDSVFCTLSRRRVFYMLDYGMMLTNDTPQWVCAAFAARRRCRCAVYAILGVLRRHRSRVAKGVDSCIAATVWATRADEGWEWKRAGKK